MMNELDNLATRNVLVVGSANMDVVMRVGQPPRPGETVLARGSRLDPGGKGGNQAVAAARLGAPVRLVAGLGDDVFGRALADAFRREGIDLCPVPSARSHPTGSASIWVDDAGQNAIIVNLGANGAVSPADIEGMERHFRWADVVLVQLEMALESVETALMMARRHGCVSVLDPGPAQPLGGDFLSLPTIVSPNETEAEALAGVPVDSVEAAGGAAEALLDRGARAVILKLGSRGCLYAAPGSGCVHAPAFRVRAVDAVAAGDAFTAGLGLAWQDGGERFALRLANACGALAATTPGAQSSMPRARDVVQFLHNSDTINEGSDQ